MDPIEKVLRDFAAAFAVTLEFRNWARSRAREKLLRGERFEVILVWGRRRFHVGQLPEDDPFFAIECADGTIERSPWVKPHGALPAWLRRG
jgi:hypothetical protein